jgi:hypothetical protein
VVDVVAERGLEGLVDLLRHRYGDHPIDER